MTESNTLPAGAAVAEGFVAMMRGYPTGVAIVTATDLAGQPWGMTCTSLCSATLQPPTLIVSLRAASPTLAAALVSGAFAVNVLRESAQAVAELFASGRLDRFDQITWDLDAESAGPHLTEDAHAVADCRVGKTIRLGDQVVMFGEIIRVASTEDCRPLLRGLRKYNRWPSE